jgi:hypothetical protein
MNPFDGGVIKGIPQKGTFKNSVTIFPSENSIIRSIKIFKENFSMANYDVIFEIFHPIFINIYGKHLKYL